jgi:mannose-1-phosphate guanylyltransferase
MRALILIGGQGTRLRPFTCDIPKPLLPVVHQPLLHYQFQVLRRHGIREVVLCASYRAEVFRRAFGNGRRWGLKLHYARERSPLGTGGAVRNAERYVNGTTLILNGDLLNAMNISAFLKSHRNSRADISVALTRVKDPTQYGLVETDDNGKIRRFLEKPSWDEVTCNTVNAGAYLFESEIIKLIPTGVSYSLERGLFPYLLQNKYRLNGFVIKGYWIDIGTVDKYLQVHLDILERETPFSLQGLARRRGFLAAPGVRLGPEIDHEGPGQVALGRGTRVDSYVRFYGSVSVGPNCRVAQGAVLDHCVVLAGTRIGEGARLERCVVGQNCRLGPHSVIGPGRALGDDSVVSRFSQL